MECSGLTCMFSRPVSLEESVFRLFPASPGQASLSSMLTAVERAGLRLTDPVLAAVQRRAAGRDEVDLDTFRQVTIAFSTFSHQDSVGSRERVGGCCGLVAEPAGHSGVGGVLGRPE